MDSSKDLREFSDAQWDAIHNARGKVEHVTPEYIDVKVSECDLEEVKTAIDGRLELRNSHMFAQAEASIDLSGEFSPLVSFLGDVHYGSGDTDYDLFHEHVNLISESPNVYTILMSNMIDNAIPAQYPDGMLQNVIPPEEQVAAMRKIIQGLDEKGKVLGAVTSPCHEGWTWSKAGQDINRLIYGYEGRRFPVLENGSKLMVNVDRVEYYFALYHKVGPFNSNLNKNNGTQRMMQLNHQSADVVAAAHHHVAEAMQTYFNKGSNQRPVCFFRTGCYKLDDLWAKGRGYTGGEPGGQSVMLENKEKRMMPFLKLEDAIEVHQARNVMRAYNRRC